MATSFNIVDGIEKIYYAVLDEKNEQYGEVKLFSDMVVEFGMSPTQNSTSVYGSNREITSILGNLTGEVTLTVQSLDEEVQAEVMGKVKAQGGGYLDKGLSKPYVALMVEKSLDGGEFEYLTLYKGKFDLAEEKAKTKEDQAEAQAQSYTARFIQLKDKTFKHAVRTTSMKEDEKTAFMEKWGKQVIKPAVAQE